MLCYIKSWGNRSKSANTHAKYEEMEEKLFITIVGCAKIIVHALSS